MTTYFVTGTDTDVGKTVVSAWLVHHLKALYWKPIQSGMNETPDKGEIQRLCNISSERILPSAYELNEPLSPHDAAKIDGVTIELNKIIKPETSEPLVIEGAGGLFVPLNDQNFMIDLIRKMACPTIVVARSGLGTINHTLLTLRALRDHNIEVAGVVLNGPINPKNKKAIEQFGKVRILSEIPYIKGINIKHLDRIKLQF